MEDILNKIIDESLFEDAEFKGKSVTLNKPFRTPDESKKFAVYAKNSNGNVVKVRFGDPDMEIKRDDKDARDNFRARHKCDIQNDKSTPSYWSCRMWSPSESVNEVLDHSFRHTVFFDSSTKKIRSVRDGVQEYLGLELGIEPYDKVFSVYRSPSTISAIADSMNGMPIINDHIDPTEKPDREKVIGLISDTDVVGELVDDYDSTLVLENKVNISDKALSLKDSGKKEFSLGYTGKMREHDIYDFEQYDMDLSTGHLALVDAARGGSILTFVDKKAKEMDKIFLDADGSVNLQKIVEISSQLQEAIRTVPIDKLSEFIPVLESIVSYGKQGSETSLDEPDAEEQMQDEEKPEDDSLNLDASYEDMDEEDKKTFGDSLLAKTYAKSISKSFSDSKAFKDAIAEAVEREVKEHASVVEKARDFLGENYSFGDKSAKQIMRDSIATVADEEFTDSELSAAFKMLNKTAHYESFGDSKDTLETLKNKEL